ncbi:MAG: hypothetical protein ACREN2_09435 [Candidatus Dormibacteria bacterium]
MTDTATTGSDGWQQLAERLLTHNNPFGPETETMLSLGRVPNGWEDAIRIADGWHVVGSSARGYSDGRIVRIDIVIDAVDSADDLVESYGALLDDSGWSPFEEPARVRAVFSSSNALESRRSFRRDELAMHVTAIESPGRPTDVRLLIDTEHVSGMARGHRGFPPGAELMPQLRLPEGVMVRRTGGSGGSDHYEQNASADTRIPVAEIGVGFAEQLSRFGWTRIAEGDDQLLAWSSWQLPDPAWRGVVLVMRPFHEGPLRLSVRVERSSAAADAAASSISRSER